MPVSSDPRSRPRRLAGLALAFPITLFLFVSLLAVNLAQTLSLAIKPFSAKAFTRFNRWVADTWWGWCVIISRRLAGIDLVVTGDPIPMRENAIVFANHQEMSDVTFLMILARGRDRLGDLKWMVKDPVKYVPGVGWGMAFLDCIFVKRNWAADRDSIERTFARLIRRRIPMWLISFPEGTRQTPEKLAGSREYAERAGLPIPAHVMIPRTKGFVASVHGLGTHVTAVYDLTLGYEQGAPTLWQYVQGCAPRAHVHVRRFPIEELPTDEEALAGWLLRRFEEKDRLLAGFYERRAFEAESSPRSAVAD